MPLLRISPNVSYLEAIASVTATKLHITNQPTNDIIETMKRTADAVFEPVRFHFGCPIHIISFYRCPELNKAVGGANHSQHMMGEAIDLQGAPNVSNADIFKYIQRNLKFDQVIWEFGTQKSPSWVHVSFTKMSNRQQALKAVKMNGRTVYENYK